MHEYLMIIVRTLFVYFLVLFVFRVMGKRELGELSILDVAVYVLIAEVAALALEDVDKPFFKSILPILLLFSIQYINAIFILKNKRLRDVIDGDPTIVVRDGVILENAMVKQRYNLDDLFQQMREQGVSSVQTISFAFLEQSGKLSIYLKDGPAFVLPIIVDGYLDLKHLRLIGKTEEWLEDELRAQGIYSVKRVFYACYEDGKLYVQLKSRKNSS
ncbi:DUF421 domain-containing protein [Metasolibacillus meyeri]|uniref:DUF421 domain-containing protein n=1 Tax=Metasolibacillus meyeri TaxID=1071052 RepID=A0AAW9NU79_9BACL|nr:DUF421 domain-containing protein [Metasolibacillus meyeri]MEC1178316.1 DUF421 domain-containing protein [Metasolibacillus meyeri]